MTREEARKLIGTRRRNPKWEGGEHGGAILTCICVDGACTIHADRLSEDYRWAWTVSSLSGNKIWFGADEFASWPIVEEKK